MHISSIRFTGLYLSGVELDAIRYGDIYADKFVDGSLSGYITILSYAVAALATT